eukprot:GHVN01006339.1.p1 GENE.GHVN01006339.1~~GHVN01006339.1.p1  ORF type:complete len:446 (+),score=106.75 GHVN01006339.1:345-1682(+)
MDSFEIPYNQISEWLTSRNKVPPHSGNLLKGLRLIVLETINDPSSSPPPSCEKSFQTLKDIHSPTSLSSRDISFNSVDDYVSDLLATPEAAKVGLLTRHHSNEHIKKWVSVRDGYVRSNLHFLDFGKILINNISFRIPALKQYIDGIDKQINKIEKRRMALDKIEIESKERYREAICEFGDGNNEMRDDAINEMRSDEVNKMGFEEDARGGLHLFVTTEVPKWLKKVITNAHLLSDARLFYIKFVTSNGNTIDQMKTLPFLRRVLEDDSTVTSCDLEGRLPSDESLVNSSVSRQRYVNDLFELKAFLDRRLAERGSPNGEGGSVDLSTDEVDRLKIIQWSAEAQCGISLATDKRTRSLFQLKESSSYFESVVFNLAVLKEACTKPSQQRQQGDRKEKQLREEMDACRKQLMQLKAETLSIREKTERGLSEMMGKKCKLTGDVNRI